MFVMDGVLRSTEYSLSDSCGASTSVNARVNSSRLHLFKWDFVYQADNIAIAHAGLHILSSVLLLARLCLPSSRQADTNIARSGAQKESDVYIYIYITLLDRPLSAAGAAFLSSRPHMKLSLYQVGSIQEKEGDPRSATERGSYDRAGAGSSPRWSLKGP